MAVNTREDVLHHLAIREMPVSITRFPYVCQATLEERQTITSGGKEVRESQANTAAGTGTTTFSSSHSWPFLES